MDEHNWFPEECRIGAKRSLRSNVLPSFLIFIVGGGVNGCRRIEDENELAVIGLKLEGDEEGMDDGVLNGPGDILR